MLNMNDHLRQSLPVDAKTGRMQTISLDQNPLLMSMRLPDSEVLAETINQNRPHAQDADDQEIKKRANPGMYRELKNLKETAWLLKNLDKNKQGCLQQALFKAYRDKYVTNSQIQLEKNGFADVIPKPSDSLSFLLAPIFQKQLEARDMVNFIIRSVNISPLLVPDKNLILEINQIVKEQEQVKDKREKAYFEKLRKKKEGKFETYEDYEDMLHEIAKTDKFAAHNIDLFAKRVPGTENKPKVYQESLLYDPSEKVTVDDQVCKSLEFECLLSMPGIANCKSVYLYQMQLSTASPEEKAQYERYYGFIQAPPKIYGFDTRYFHNLPSCVPSIGNEYQKEPQKHIPQLIRRTMTSPLLTALIWEEIVKSHEGMECGQFLEKKSANLLVNMSHMLLNNNFVMQKDKSFKQDNNFLEAFQCFVDRLPNDVFAVRDGKGSIVNEEVKQVLKCLFEGQTKDAACVNFLSSFFKQLYSSINIERILHYFKFNKKKDDDLVQDDFEIPADPENKGDGFEVNLDSSHQQQKKGIFGTMKDVITGSGQDETEEFKKNFHEREKVTTTYKEAHDALHGKNSVDNTPYKKQGCRLDDVECTQELDDDLDNVFPECKLLLARLYTDPELTDVKTVRLISQCQHKQTNELLTTMLQRRSQYGRDATNEEGFNYHNMENKEPSRVFKKQHIDASHIIQRDAAAARQFRESARQSERLGLPRQSARFTTGIEFTSRDTTYYCIQIAKIFFDQLNKQSKDIPYTLRIMLKIVLNKMQRAVSPPEEKDKQKQRIDQVILDCQIITEFLLGSWLATGFRIAECYGLLPYVKTQQTYVLQLFSAVQLIIEHAMLLETMPTNIESVNKYFNVPRINQYLESHIHLMNLVRVLAEIQDVPTKVLAVSLRKRYRELYAMTEHEKRTSHMLDQTVFNEEEHNKSLFACAIRVSDMFFLMHLSEKVYLKYIKQTSKNVRQNIRPGARSVKKIGQQENTNPLLDEVMKLKPYVDYEQTHMRDMLLDYAMWDSKQRAPHMSPLSERNIVPYTLSTELDQHGKQKIAPFEDTREEYLMIAEDGIFENKTQTSLIKNLYELMQELIRKHKAGNAGELDKLNANVQRLQAKIDKLSKPLADANQMQMVDTSLQCSPDTIPSKQLNGAQEAQEISEADELKALEEDKKTRLADVKNREDWHRILDTKPKKLFRLYFLIIKLLRKTQAQDMRLIELRHDYEKNSIFSFKSMADIVDRIQKTCFNKAFARQAEIIGQQIQELCQELGLRSAETSRKQGLVIVFLASMAHLELRRRREASDSLCSRGASIKLLFDRQEKIDKINRDFYVDVYQDLKLCLMLTEVSPYVCILYNDGKKIKDSNKLKFLVERDYLGFSIHSTQVCKESAQTSSFTAYAMFEDPKTRSQNAQQFDENEYDIYTKIDEDREMRCDIMYKLEGTKHIEIKFFDFFVLIMKRTFATQLKNLIRHDNFLLSETKGEKGETEQNCNHGDREHLVDSYRQFIDKYVPNITDIFTARNKSYVRFVENLPFQEYLKQGVHRFYTQSLYKTLFRKGENDQWSQQAFRDEEIENAFIGNYSAIRCQEEALRESIQANKQKFNRKTLVRQFKYKGQILKSECITYVQTDDMFRRIDAITREQQQTIMKIQQMKTPNEVQRALFNTVQNFWLHAQYYGSKSFNELSPGDFRISAVIYFLANSMFEKRDIKFKKQDRILMFSFMKFAQLFYHGFQGNMKQLRPSQLDEIYNKAKKHDPNITRAEALLGFEESPSANYQDLLINRIMTDFISRIDKSKEDKYRPTDIKDNCSWAFADSSPDRKVNLRRHATK